MTRLWERMWFSPESASNLAAARVIFAAHAMWVLLSRDLPSMSALPSEFYTGVGMSARLRFLLFPGHATFEYAMQWIAMAALAAAVFNVVPRVSCLLAGVLLYHLAPLEAFFWTPNPYERGLTIDVLALIVIAATPRPVADRVPAWTVRLPQFFLASIYLLAGISKLRRVGFEWMEGENQRRWLLAFNQDPQVSVFNSLGPWIAAHPALCWAMGIGAMLLDLGFVAAVFWKRSRVVIIPFALAGHAAILFAFNIFFINIPQLLVFVDWEAVGTRWRPIAKRIGRFQALAVLSALYVAVVGPTALLRGRGKKTTGWTPASPPEPPPETARRQW